MFNEKYNYLKKDRNWKEKNKEYLKELQSFLDKADNIEDESLKSKVVGQMLRCDDILTKLAEKEFIKFYKSGLKNSKKE